MKFFEADVVVATCTVYTVMAPSELNNNKIYRSQTRIPGPVNPDP